MFDLRASTKPSAMFQTVNESDTVADRGVSGARTPILRQDTHFLGDVFYGCSQEASSACRSTMRGGDAVANQIEVNTAIPLLPPASLS